MFKSVSWTFWRCELKSATLTAPTVVVGWQLISSSHTTFMSTYALTISVRGGGGCWEAEAVPWDVPVGIELLA